MGHLLTLLSQGSKTTQKRGQKYCSNQRAGGQKEKCPLDMKGTTLKVAGRVCTRLKNDQSSQHSSTAWEEIHEPPPITGELQTVTAAREGIIRCP